MCTSGSAKGHRHLSYLSSAEGLIRSLPHMAAPNIVGACLCCTLDCLQLTHKLRSSIPCNTQCCGVATSTDCSQHFQGLPCPFLFCWLVQRVMSLCECVQGALQLLEKAEIRDVFATAGVQFEQLKRMGRFGGVALQLQGLMQMGFNKVCCQYCIPRFLTLIPCYTNLHQSCQMLRCSDDVKLTANHDRRFETLTTTPSLFLV